MIQMLYHELETLPLSKTRLKTYLQPFHVMFLPKQCRAEFLLSVYILSVPRRGRSFPVKRESLCSNCTQSVSSSRGPFRQLLGAQAGPCGTSKPPTEPASPNHECSPERPTWTWKDLRRLCRYDCQEGAQRAYTLSNYVGQSTLTGGSPY